MSEVFTGRKGKFVELKDTIEGFAALLEGKGDDYPEAAICRALWNKLSRKVKDLLSKLPRNDDK